MSVCGKFLTFTREIQYAYTIMDEFFYIGMLLRLFMDFYDMEVVEEEVFLRWKEEVNDEYPGKGKALFQVIILGSLI